ncbi:PorP/SprF family type IX secretion system membrane protein [Ichthyobacterium seriolicida]|uniref:Bacteroidetes-specific membrane protein n=1 Tax=Ichthyobacterium seriolicida TaxID=242600 RepID=A0A1J1E4N4_9FLAO|nr:PorP/SprF family type IX secretion system membrane protein [Ichthyobacterium seriolicida]BAV95012.1 hypothetical protein JBKA6_0999 [Ichthyobacterium seriolicida]
MSGLIKNICISLFLVLVTRLCVVAQTNIPHYYHQYLMNNYFMVNPAYVGQADVQKIRFIDSSNWYINSEYPRVYNMSYQGQLSSDPMSHFLNNSGIGVYLFRDINGIHSKDGGEISYAYRLNFNKIAYKKLHTLSFGISASFLVHSEDQTKLSNSIFNDPAITGTLRKEYIANFGFGAHYVYKFFFLSFSIKDFLEQKTLLISNFADEDISRRDYMMSIGYLVYTDNKFDITPSLLINYSVQDFSFMDFNLRSSYLLNKNNRIWILNSYRVNYAERISNPDKLNLFRPHSITNMFGLSTYNWNFAYSYGIVMDSGFEGIHQIMIGYDILSPNKMKIKSGFCGCIN